MRRDTTYDGRNRRGSGDGSDHARRHGLGSFGAARDHLDAARRHSFALRDDAYDTSIRTAIDEVSAAVEKRDTAPRVSAPSAGG